MNEFLPQGFLDFELGSLDYFEDDSIKLTRNPDGSIQMEGKPLKDVFIYESGSRVPSSTIPATKPGDAAR